MTLLAKYSAPGYKPEGKRITLQKHIISYNNFVKR